MHHAYTRIFINKLRGYDLLDSVKENWDVPEWRQCAIKAQQNLDAAELLFEKQFISLSAFHVQQCVELAIKAVVYKFGFKEHLQKTKVARSHIPAGELIFAVHRFVEKQLKMIDQSIFDDDFRSSILEARYEIKQLTCLLRHAKRQRCEKFMELWLYSLKIDTPEWIATALDSYKKSLSTKLTQQLTVGTLALAHEFFTKLLKYALTNRQKPLIHFAKKETRELFLKHGLSTALVDAFFNSEGEFKKIVSNEINRYGPDKLMDLILKPGGLLSKFSDIQNPGGLLSKFSDIKRSKSPKLDIGLCIKFLWIAHLATISPTVILLYPHVIIGRYPRAVRNKTQNSKIKVGHTEDLYLERAAIISKLIGEARCVLERVNRILDAHTDD